MTLAPLMIHPHDLYVGAGNEVTVHGDVYQVADQTADLIEAIYRAPGSNERLFLWFPKTWIEYVNDQMVLVNVAVARQEAPVT